MNKKIGLKEAISIGIGGMVGGGIFAVLGSSNINYTDLFFNGIYIQKV